jgi:hypothetical protein
MEFSNASKAKMRKLLVFLGLCCIMVLISTLIAAIYLLFFAKKPNCAEVSFENRSAEQIKSILIVDDYLHMSLTPDNHGNFQTVYLTSKWENSYNINFSFQFESGVILQATEEVRPTTEMTIVIFKDRISRAMRRFDAL